MTMVLPMREGADIRLQIKVKNARIFRAMQRAGIATVGGLVRRIVGQAGGRLQPGGCYSLVCELTNFKARPITKKGEWRTIALKVANALHVEPDELWPEYLREVEMKKGDVAIDVSVEQLTALAGSEQSLLEHDEVRGLLDRLPTRKRQVIELRFGLNGNGMHTLKEAGDVLGGLTPERVRQIELSALRILRTPKSPRLPEVYGPPAPYRPVNRALILDDDLWRHCDKLTKAERALIELRYGPRHRSTADIAAVFGVTEGESIEMETRAMAHLRELAEGGR